MEQWIVIRDFDYKEKLPKEDCMIWITRVFFTGERWVQKVEYYAGENIEWDGTLAWMPDCEKEPEPRIWVMTLLQYKMLEVKLGTTPSKISCKIELGDLGGLWKGGRIWD